jgi:hypothetical protein
VAAETMAPKGRPGKCLIIPLPVGSSVYIHVLPVGSTVLCRRCLSYWAPPTHPATPTAKAPPTFKNFILLYNCTESLLTDRTYFYNFTAVCRYLCESMHVFINTSHLSVKISTFTNITVNCYTVFNVYIYRPDCTTPFCSMYVCMLYSPA